MWIRIAKQYSKYMEYVLIYNIWFFSFLQDKPCFCFVDYACSIFLLSSYCGNCLTAVATKPNEMATTPKSIPLLTLVLLPSTTPSSSVLINVSSVSFFSSLESFCFTLALLSLLIPPLKLLCVKTKFFPLFFYLKVQLS